VGLQAVAPRSFEEVCATIAPRLRARFPEMEASLANLIEAKSNPGESADPASGKVGRETLRAYFASHRITNRLRAIEELFGRPLEEFATDLETALRLAD